VAIELPIQFDMIVQATTTDAAAPNASTNHALFYFATLLAVAYAFLSGFHTIAEFDLGWQMATARWIVQHHQIPSVDVLSFTAEGQPWIYPVGAELIFYGAFLLAGYALISWITAATCAGITLILLRQRSLITVALTILAIPLIAQRATARAEMFTVVLFAATLSLLWQHHQTGKARLWLLPPLMIFWVNFHPGFVAGLALLVGYIGLETLDAAWPDQRAAAFGRLKSAWPWLLATVPATLVNPWGWRIFQVVARQQAAMGAHSQLIMEWAPMPLNSTRILSACSLRDPNEFYLLLLLACALIIPVALIYRKIGAAIFLAAAVYAPLRHMRFVALFAIVVVIVGGGILTACAEDLRHRTGKRLRHLLSAAVLLPVILLAVVRSHGLWTNHFYMSGSNLLSFGTGLSWWFPKAAADFVDREKLPGQIFSSIEDGGYLSFRLGPTYKDYIDGRAIPFGTDAILGMTRLKVTPPDSPLWKNEADRYDLNVILIPIGRFSALQFFPVLKQFCESDLWRPVYLDEVSVVFLRRRPETEDLIRRLQINCATAPLPLTPDSGEDPHAFNQWANAASVLLALGRSAEALSAANRALAIFPDSGYLHFLRGHMFLSSGNQAQAEQDYLLATKLEPNLVAPWSALAAFYQDHGRIHDAILAWQHAADASRWPWDPLVSLGYANLQAQMPNDALYAFDRAAASLPAHYELMVDNTVIANIAHGRSRSYFYLRNLPRAIAFDEDAARLLPDPKLWLELAALYERAGRLQDANSARAQAMALSPQE